MSNRTVLSATLTSVLLLCLSSPALAGVSDDFAACDGRMKPKSSDDGMRGEAAIKTGYGGLGRNKGAEAIIAACDKMLVHPNLRATQTVRRAHMLRARAAAKLELGRSDDALADLDAAEAVTVDRAQDKLFQRSMGVSLRLLRAIALAQKGELDRAAQLAATTARERPYAIQVQIAAAMLQMGRPAPAGQTPAEPATAGNLLRLEPRSLPALAQRAARAGDFAEVVRLAELAPPPKAAAVAPANPGDRAGAMLASLQFDMSSLEMQYDLAFALAATGNPSKARTVLEAARAKAQQMYGAPAAAAPKPLASTPTQAAATPAPATPPASSPAAEAAPVAEPIPVVKPQTSLVSQLLGPRDRLADARIAIAEGRIADARKLSEGNLPLSQATAELIASINKAEGKPAPVLPPMFGLKTDRYGAMASELLIAPESQRSTIDYEKSRPNILGALIGGALSMGTTLLGGINRTDGFRSTAAPDGTMTVEFTGNTTSAPMVQEMTLLRAAELARAAGKWGLVIDRRTDFARYLVTSQYGTEISRTPTGYKTELVVRFVDQGAEPDRAFDAVGLIDALGPFYYSEGKKP